ncbi:MAG: molybdate ABC transporter substrate-binding protein [Terriglobia bacterium]
MALSILSKMPFQIAALVFTVVSLPAAPPRELVIAAAANLADALPAIGAGFEAATGFRAVFSSGSTAQLARQIENGAPFDVFLAADTEHIDDLIAKGLLIKSSRADYATGVLALWIPPQSRAHIARVEDLVLASVRTIAIANPQLAPYGQASVETLKNLGIWEKVKSKAVYAGSIAMTKQYGVTGNADAVFSAWPLVFREKGRLIRVDDKLHHPLTQALAIVKASGNLEAARAFRAFLLSPRGRGILAQYGYE